MLSFISSNCGSGKGVLVFPASRYSYYDLFCKNFMALQAGFTKAAGFTISVLTAVFTN
jgi:hypothetical protein